MEKVDLCKAFEDALKLINYGGGVKRIRKHGSGRFDIVFMDDQELRVAMRDHLADSEEDRAREILAWSLLDFHDMEWYQQDCLLSYIDCPPVNDCVCDEDGEKDCFACKEQWLNGKWSE